MLISLHLPKTAGSSFLKSLHEHFGQQLLRDNDNPMHIPVYDRNRYALQSSIISGDRTVTGIQCIYGHFLPLKYLLLSVKQDVTFITWMRNPVERLLSHYYFWKRPFDPAKVGPLRRKMADEKWSLERFCLGSELQSLYRQYLWGFPVENFDFIGITEFYEEDLRYFSNKFLGMNLPCYQLNTGNKKSGSYDIDENFRKEIESFHRDDMILYEYALEKRLASHHA